MAWVAVDKNSEEFVYQNIPTRNFDYDIWSINSGDHCQLPKGSIEKLIGRRLTWEDEPVELKEEPFETRMKMCKTCRYKNVSKLSKPCSLCFNKSHYEKEEK